MSWTSWLVWGFAATALLTTLMAGSEGLGLTRMNIPHMLGTMFTPNRDRAKVYGAIVHFLNGWAFSIVYVAGFHSAHVFTWWFGAVLGLLHGAFVAAVVLPVMPGVHPRMASELRGPTVARQLEPPGFLALNYGMRTPISILIAHVAFGAMLGGFYKPADGVQRRAVNVPALSLRVPFGGTHEPLASSPALSTAPSSRAKKANSSSQDSTRGPTAAGGSMPSTAKLAFGGSGAKPNPQDRSSQSAILVFMTPRSPGARWRMPAPKPGMS
jgi:hypothetical protein